MDIQEKNSYNFNSVDLLIYIWDKRWILAIVGFLAGVISIIASLLITPMYKASVVMFPVTDATISKSLLNPNVQGRQGVYGIGEEEQAEQLLQVLHSADIRDRIIEQYNLFEHYGIDTAAKYPMTTLYETYKSNINFSLTEYMSVEITVMDSDPQYASDIANSISNLVDTVFNQMKRQRSEAAFLMVEKEYMDAERDLKIIEDSLDAMISELAFEKRVESKDDLLLTLMLTDPDNATTYFSLIYRLQRAVGKSADMKLRYQEVWLEKEQNLPYKFIVERASPAEKKAYPKKSLIVMVSTLTSLLMALILLIVIDTIRKRISS